ncbi:hypothetical protein KP806_01530 [Paenibacillus sp. N4]|uniref:hypothetical protein n=1 Tax=Paenibacillus vietnamensis TaxID=2590547 RepID=UPI001CD16281|nr:hypothetical protein [Paenibacillus vietnamensis]MCA0753715.1 hypothetical protein [Paenibacillus vietnamensis]
MTLNLQGELADIQSAVSQMNQNSQPTNKYVYNDLKKFGICHDAINLGALSGSFQSGLFNASAPSRALPPTISTTNITPQAGPTAAIAPAGTQVPVTGGAPAGAQVPVTGGAPGVFPGAPILEAPSPTLSPGMAIPPGLPIPPGASGVTAIPPGFTLPPGSVQIAPGLAILPPGTIPSPAAAPRSTP